MECYSVVVAAQSASLTDNARVDSVVRARPVCDRIPASGVRIRFVPQPPALRSLAESGQEGDER